jgi:hypothetical protein
MDPREILASGREILEPVLVPRGFVFRDTGSGKSSGGDFASGRYEKADRFIEIHFRDSLGLVTYHMGKRVASHESYMRSLLGSRGGNKFPGFSNDLLDGFRDLAFDLEHFSIDFLAGSGEEFARCVKISEERENRTGFSRMAEFES